MTRWIASLVFYCLLGGVASGLAAQDRVTLKNGSAFTGKILAQNKEWVTIKSSFGVVSFRREEVEKVESGASSVRGVEPKAPRNGRSNRRGRPKARAPSAVRGFVRRAQTTYGVLKDIRVDRHPAYASLRRSRPGAWVLYDAEGGRPRHDQERWLVESVSGDHSVVLKEFLLSGKPVAHERVTINHLDFGPQMPGRIQKENTLGTEMVRIAMGQFATLRVSQDVFGGSGVTRFYCPEVPVVGLVQAKNGERPLRRLLRFAWEGGATPRPKPVRAAPRTKAPGATSPRPAVPRAPHPVAAAFLAAKPGDYAVWEDPNSGRLWREFVRERTAKQVTIVMQVWKRDAFQFEGIRTYDLGFLSRDYLDRIDARRAGEEILKIGSGEFRCKKWQSPSGNVVYFTSPEVRIGALVQHVINGRVVRRLREVGQDPRLVAK